LPEPARDGDLKSSVVAVAGDGEAALVTGPLGRKVCKVTGVAARWRRGACASCRLHAAPWRAQSQGAAELGTLALGAAARSTVESHIEVCLSGGASMRGLSKARR